MSDSEPGFQAPLRSLILLPFASNPGYAITALESLFYSIALELAGGDQARVHFGYANFRLGHPRSLPPEFENLLEVDAYPEHPQEWNRAARYVKEHGIDFVLLFDIELLHPLIRLLRQAGARRILSYYGAPVAHPMPRWKAMLKKVQTGLSRSKLDGLIFESQAMANTAVDGRGVPRDRIDVVPLGVDTERFAIKISDYVYRQTGFSRDRKVVIYSGHMEERKGVRTLVEAAIDLLKTRGRKDVGFLLCGNRNEEESRPYRDLYEGSGFEPFIRFGGYRADLDRLYPSCFCGVIPSSGWDSFTQSSLEMASSGLPVVASRLGGLPEAVSDQETGLLFEPGDSRALADCLAKLLDEPDWAFKLGLNGRQRCEQHFTKRKQRERLLACVQRRVTAGVG